MIFVLHIEPQLTLNIKAGSNLLCHIPNLRISVTEVCLLLPHTKQNKKKTDFVVKDFRFIFLALFG